MQTDTQAVRVWDLPTRLFHWSLVASFATAFAPNAVAVSDLNMNGEPQYYVGHNPAGAVAIFALLGLGLVAAASGWTVYEDMGWHFMEELHEVAANGMMAVVVIHIAGVIVSSWLHRENLVKAMVTGWKNIRNENPAG